jgi:hypothetical protein
MELPDLKGKRVAIVAMGSSAGFYITARCNSMEYDEVWTINATGGVFPCNRMFMMDPPSRFLDDTVAGNQTSIVSKTITTDQTFPIYSCITDVRCPSVVDFPLEAVMKATGNYYFNNTPAYAMGFAAATGVSELHLFGLDYSYRSNVHVAEAGRACVEFWIGVLNAKGCAVVISPSSPLMDTDVPAEERLYGYHRLPDPLRLDIEDGKFSVKRNSMHEHPPEPEDGYLYKG